MMLVVGITDFSLKDVLKPEPDRVAYILSGLINFGKFREMQLANFEQLTEKTVRSLAVSLPTVGGCVLTCITPSGMLRSCRISWWRRRRPWSRNCRNCRRSSRPPSTLGDYNSDSGVCLL